MYGLTFSDWRRLLWDNRYAVEPRYFLRALQITLLSLRASRWRSKELERYGSRIAQAEILPPLFVLGHWRNGTSLIHDLLSLDPQFAYANLFQITHPHTCLSLESRVEKALAGQSPVKRPMDNMEVTFRSPGEDEMALAILSLCSPLIAWSFPKRQEHYDRYLTFRNVPPEELEEWKEIFLNYMKKLTLRYGRPLLLKSPPHTGRVRILLELLPRSRFVHVYRNPYVVFRSTQHLHRTAIAATQLQTPRAGEADEGILRRYREMYEAYFEEKHLIPPGQLCEIRFEDLEQDLIGNVRRVYETLNLTGFAEVLPKLEEYVASHRGYKKNKYDPLPEPIRQRVAQEWRRSFEEWGYPL